jgi:hypothetical protein
MPARPSAIDKSGNVIVGASGSSSSDTGIRTLKVCGWIPESLPGKVSFAGSGTGTDLLKALAVDSYGNAIITCDVRTTKRSGGFLHCEILRR